MSITLTHFSCYGRAVNGLPITASILENLAKNIAYKVKRTKRPVSLEPMNPFERRIIHSALQGDRYVNTHSEGDEPYRHVVVTLKREK